MRRALVILLLVVAPLPAMAADFEAGIRHLATTMMAESGEVDVAASRGFAATAEVFWTERVSTQFAATFLNPATILRPSNPPPADVDLGTLGIDAYSASARWYFAPRARFSPFAGAGVALVTFGNLEDRFADDLEIEFGNETTFLVEGGLRYRFQPRIFIDVAVSYMPLEAEADFVGYNPGTPAIVPPQRVSLDPVTVSVGAAWRF